MNQVLPGECSCGMVIWDPKPPYPVYSGMFIVCIYCGQVLRLNDGLRPEVSSIDHPDLAAHPRLRTELLMMTAYAESTGQALRRKHKDRKPPPST